MSNMYTKMQAAIFTAYKCSKWVERQIQWELLCKNMLSYWEKGNSEIISKLKENSRSNIPNVIHYEVALWAH